MRLERAGYIFTHHIEVYGAWKTVERSVAKVVIIHLNRSLVGSEWEGRCAHPVLAPIGQPFPILMFNDDIPPGLLQ